MFTELPRYFGFPHQVYCEKRFAFNSFVKTFNGKAPLMVSTYQFKDRRTPIVDSVVFDIDSYFGLRIPHKNTERLKKFCDKNDIKYLISFSGGKGFHFFMIFKPIIPTTEEERGELRNKLYSMQEAIVKEQKIEAIDFPTMGRLHFLIRFPTSKYVRFENGQPVNNEFYCRNILPDDFDKGLKHISKISKEPGVVPKKPETNKTLDDIIALLPTFKIHKRMGKLDNIELVRAGMVTPTIEAVGIPCLKEIASATHPKHHERIELVAFLKFMGYSDIAIVSFIQSLKWFDYNYAKTAYQVSTVRARYPNCKYLRIAYGEMCDKCSLGKRRKKNENKI